MKILLGLMAMMTLAAASPLPTFKLSCDKGNSVSACLNHKVTLEARMVGFDKSSANEVMQHPAQLTPFDTDLEQNYTQISQNLGQVVVLSKAIKCTKVQLKGTFSQVKLSCSSGQSGKCAYSNYLIRVDSFVCQK